jgi:hypothetical protein
LFGEKTSVLYYPRVSGKELKEIENILEFCQPELQQSVLDEIEGIRLAGGIKRGAVPLARTLVKKTATGEFSLSAGIRVQAERERRQTHEEAICQATAAAPAGRTAGEPMTEEAISMLPPNMRARARMVLQ